MQICVLRHYYPFLVCDFVYVLIINHFRIALVELALGEGQKKYWSSRKTSENYEFFCTLEFQNALTEERSVLKLKVVFFFLKI